MKKKIIIPTLIWEYMKTEMKIKILSKVLRSFHLSWVLDVDAKIQYNYFEKC